jgi:hypothetical protein
MAAHNADDFDRLVPRPLDQARPVPQDTGADLWVLDGRQDPRGARRPALWEVWRDRLPRWRTEARERLTVDDALYGRGGFDGIVLWHADPGSSGSTTGTSGTSTVTWTVWPGSLPTCTPWA